MAIIPANFPKSSGYLSALKEIHDANLLLVLDEIREDFIRNGTWKQVEGFETSITVLKLDFGMPDDELREVLSEGLNQLAKEAANNLEGAKRRFRPA